MVESILTIYQRFLEEEHEAALRDLRHPLARLFVKGTGDVEKLLPGFDGRVRDELTRLFERHAESAVVRELSEWMLEQADIHRDDGQLRYAFIAVQRHLALLIGCLDGEDAAYLADRFAAAFPRRERFPSHVRLIAQLKERAKAG